MDEVPIFFTVIQQVKKLFPVLTTERKVFLLMFWVLLLMEKLIPSIKSPEMKLS